MAAIFVASADVNDLSIWDDYSGSGVTVNSIYGSRTGTTAYRLDGYSGYLRHDVSNLSTIYGRFAYKFLTGDQADRLRFRSGSTDIAMLESLIGRVKVYRGNSILLEDVFHSFFEDWSCLEFRLVLHASTGIWQVKINGQLILDISNENTGTGPIDNVLFHSGDFRYHMFDDIVFDDADWPGLGGVFVSRPNAAGNYQDWDTPDYANVADDSDATYIATDEAVAAKASYEFPGVTGTVNRAMFGAKFQGSGTIRPFTRTGTTDTPGSSAAADATPAWSRMLMTSLPDEIGVEVTV